ncbi:hypothetical protein D9611_014666 [Ephemerocybe angulata]|uniref:VWFA domain-containing protein n=1 Tax=Ephemerocybe angulata TaxID=980116 RepID=A0A8H5AS79_9AGAR|nr:hypothetical protein D9611_014666 [Tulosesus angulatus]
MPNPFRATKNLFKSKPTMSTSSSSTPAPTTEPTADQSTDAQPGPAEGPKYDASKPLDILFLQDATGSQGPYISSARSAIQSICTKISESASLSQGAIRFGLIAFRDHPPQDTSFVTKNFGFTSDVGTMITNLASLVASGGGDGPEASTAALADALNMEWEEDAVKIVVLITDAAPHGIGEPGDGFPNGSPDQNDPLEIARQMAERGITLYVVACEPSLSRYLNAVDFYKALCQITSGRMVPLLNAAQLGDFIVGSAVETVETEKLINEYQSTILEDVYGQGKPVEEVIQQMQQKMAERKTEIKTFNVENPYEQSRESESNVNVWAQAKSLGNAKGKTQAIQTPRLKKAFQSSGGSYGSYGAPPPAPVMARPGASARPMQQMRQSVSSFGKSWFNGSRTPSSAPAPPAPAAYGAPVDYAAAPSYASAPQAQQVSLMSQQVDQSQTNRIVMQSLMRNAKVGPGGVLTPTGEYSGAKGVQMPQVKSEVSDAMDTGA